jgi:RNA polymerase subunit RPABC4/transcription elongation factor Spt4
MGGTPGYGPWSPYGGNATPEQRAQLEAMLRTLRDQRPAVIAEIGEYLYGLVMRGQLGDQIVIGAFRRLYDHDQQIQQTEAGLRALSTSYPSVSASPASYAPPYAQPAYSAPPVVSAQPRQAPGWSPPASTPPPSVPAGMTPSVASDDERIDTRPASSGPSSRDATRPAALRQPEAAPTVPKRATDRVCMHCKTPLRPKDTICPVCGLPAEEMPASATCTRCGTELKPTDTACPVCGTPR